MALPLNVYTLVWTVKALATSQRWIRQVDCSGTASPTISHWLQQSTRLTMTNSYNDNDHVWGTRTWTGELNTKTAECRWQWPCMRHKAMNRRIEYKDSWMQMTMTMYEAQGLEQANWIQRQLNADDNDHVWGTRPRTGELNTKTAERRWQWPCMRHKA